MSTAGPSIARDEVAHLARLARLDLGPDELDRLAAELDVILGAVARVSEVAADDIPPTSHAVPLTNVFREDDVRPSCRETRSWPRPPPRKRIDSGSRASSVRRRERVRHRDRSHCR